MKKRIVDFIINAAIITAFIGLLYLGRFLVELVLIAFGVA